MGSFGNICRLCCGEESELVGIFNQIGFSNDFSGKIKKFLFIEVQEADVLPRSLCQECVSNLVKFEEFYEKSQLSQKILAEMHLETVMAMQRAKENPESEEANILVQSLLLQEQLNKRILNTGAIKRKVPKPQPVKGLRKRGRPPKNTAAKDLSIKMEPLDSDIVLPPRRDIVEHVGRDGELNKETDAATINNPENTLGNTDAENMEVDGIARHEHPRKAKLVRQQFSESDGGDRYDDAPFSPEAGHGDSDAESMASEVETRQSGSSMLLDSRVTEPIVKLELLSGQQESAEDSDWVSRAIARSSSDPLSHIARCSMCEIPFLALSSLLLHHRIAHPHEPEPEKPLLCVFCNNAFKDLVGLADHMGDRHAGQTRSSPRKRRQRNLQCKICNKVVQSQAGLKSHMNIHFRDAQKKKKIGGVKGKIGRPKKTRDPTTNTASNVRCSICKGLYMNAAALRLHLEAEHEDTDCITPFLCTVCDKEFSCGASLAHHRVKHKIGKTRPCPVCSKPFKPKYLAKHMVVHQSERPHKCDECGKFYKCADSLRLHKNIHKPHDEKYRESCDICDRRFVHKGALHVHVKAVHQKLKEFECRHCNKAFASKCSVEIHERSHTGEKPYECQLCDYKCISKGILKSHLLIHNDVKAFECKVCGKRTRSRKLMREHELTHTDIKPYPCRYCDKKFRNSTNQKTHERVHTGEKPWSCQFCSRTFADNGNCHKHMKQVHHRELGLPGPNGKPIKSRGRKIVPAINNAVDGVNHLPGMIVSSDNIRAASTSAGISVTASNAGTSAGITRMMAPSSHNNMTSSGNHSSSSSNRNLSSVINSSRIVDNIGSGNSSSSHILVNNSMHDHNSNSSSSMATPPLHSALGHHSALDTASLSISNLMSELRDNHHEAATMNTYNAASALQLLRPSSVAQHLQQQHLLQTPQQQQQFAQLQQQAAQHAAQQAAAAQQASQQAAAAQQQRQQQQQQQAAPAHQQQSSTSNSASMYPQLPAHMQHPHMQHLEQQYTPPFPTSSYDPTTIHLQRL